MLNGVFIQSIYNSKSAFTGAPPIPMDAPFVLLSPGKFLKSRRIFFERESFSAEQILTFVANKCGGVHFDLNRNKPWHQALERAAHFMTFGNPNEEREMRVQELGEPGGPCMIALPKEKGNVWSCLDIELLSVAQALLNVHCNGQRLVITNET